jgi:hypothetical protein
MKKIFVSLLLLFAVFTTMQAKAFIFPVEPQDYIAPIPDIKIVLNIGPDGTLTVDWSDDEKSCITFILSYNEVNIASLTDCVD